MTEGSPPLRQCASFTVNVRLPARVESFFPEDDGRNGRVCTEEDICLRRAYTDDRTLPEATAYVDGSESIRYMKGKSLYINE
jgi:hypothetical protein